LPRGQANDSRGAILLIRHSPSGNDQLQGEVAPFAAGRVPIEVPTKFGPVINLKAAKTLGLTTRSRCGGGRDHRPKSLEPRGGRPCIFHIKPDTSQTPPPDELSPVFRGPPRRRVRRDLNGPAWCRKPRSVASSPHET